MVSRIAAFLSTALAAVMATAGTDPLFAWPTAQESAGRQREAMMLRRGLVDRWLGQLEGDTAATGRPAPSMDDLVKAGKTAPEPAAQTRRWQALLQRHLALAPATAAVPLPPELEGSTSRLVPVAPGLWMQWAPDGTFRATWWWLQLRHEAPADLALGDFVLETRTAPDQARPLRWQCVLPRYAEHRVLPPSQPEPYLCRIAGAEVDNPKAHEAQLRALAANPAPILRVTVAGDALAAALRRLEDAAVKAAPPPAAVAAVPAAPAALRGDAGQARRPAKPAPASTGWKDVLQWLGMSAAALGVYTLLHRLGGGVFAFGLTWLAGTGLAIATAGHAVPGLRAGLAAGSHASALLPGLALVAAVAVPLAATIAVALVHALLFGAREQVLQSARRAMARSMLRVLQRQLDRLLRR